MANYILADNQDLTCFAVESLLRSDERNVVHRASDRADRPGGILYLNGKNQYEETDDSHTYALREA